MHAWMWKMAMRHDAELTWAALPCQVCCGLNVQPLPHSRKERNGECMDVGKDQLSEFVGRRGAGARAGTCVNALQGPLRSVKYLVFCGCSLSFIRVNIPAYKNYTLTTTIAHLTAILARIGVHALVQAWKRRGCWT